MMMAKANAFFRRIRSFLRLDRSGGVAREILRALSPAVVIALAVPGLALAQAYVGPFTSITTVQAKPGGVASLCANNGTDCFAASNSGGLQATVGGLTAIDMSSAGTANFPNTFKLSGHQVVTCPVTYDPPAVPANSTVSTGSLTCTGVTATMRCATAGNVTTTTINIGGVPSSANTITMFAQCMNGASACADLASASYQMLCWN